MRTVVQSTAFSTRTVIWLISVGCFCFAGAAFFAIFGEGGAAARAGTHSYSYSAIGHRAFVETLRRLDVPVVVSRNNSRAKAGSSALLILAEPDRTAVSEEALTDLLTAETLLLILPKWSGRPDEDNPRWLERASPLPSKAVQAVLELAVPDGRVQRPLEPPSWQAGGLDIVPTLDRPQLVQSTALSPVVATDQGILVGALAREGQTVWVLSDPDILSNHGLGRGDNAALALAVVEALRPSDSAVVFDETIHGFGQNSSLWRLIFQFPYLIATLQVAAAVIALVWATAGRFGSPVPAERPLQAGKETLLNNMASLLQFGGHGSVILRRYLDATLRDVVRRLRAPRTLEGEELIDWVDRVGAARGAQRRFRDLREQVEAASGKAGPGGPGLLGTAQDLYRWKREVIDGS